VALPFSLADARLSEFLAGQGLCGASNNAYEAGLREFPLQVGPVGAVSGLSKRVHVYVLPPRSTPAGTTVPFRWLATGVTGQLFPALDADLDLSPEGPEASRLLINARYEPPLGAVGAKIDRILLGRVADSTIRELLRRIEAILVQREGVVEGVSVPDGRTRHDGTDANEEGE